MTDGDTRAALAATRSLGRAGHSVLVGAERQDSLAGASRHAASRFRYPEPLRHPGDFVAAVTRCAAESAADVVMPMTDVTSLLLTRHRERLPAECHLPLPAASALDSAADKLHMLEIARELGVPVPATVVCRDPAEGASAARELGTPVVVKPSRSRVETPEGFLHTRVQYARDQEEIARRLRELPPAAFPVLLQERIAGPGVGLFACCDRGRRLALFAHRRLREKPPSGGVSVLRESVPADPRAARHAERLLERLGWHGVAMVEFKQDRRDGSLRLMEVNGRFWGSLQLAIDAGVDFPGLLLAVAMGEPVEPVASYRHGVQSRWLLGDLDVLLGTLFRRRRSLDLPEGFPTRLGLLRQFLRFRAPGLHYEVLTRDDPAPGWLELRRWLTGG